MKVAQWAIDKLKPYSGNPRLISERAVDSVAASTGEFGFRQPIVVDEDGVIIEGHTRRLAAMKLGLDKVPVHVASDLTPDQVSALRIIDNKTSELGEFDNEKLSMEIGQLQSIDWTEYGFEPIEIEALSVIGKEGSQWEEYDKVTDGKESDNDNTINPGDYSSVNLIIYSEKAWDAIGETVVAHGGTWKPWGLGKRLTLVRCK